MNNIGKISLTFIFINLFYKVLTILLDHPYFLGLQKYLLYVWEVTLQISRKGFLSIKKEARMHTLKPKEETMPFVSSNTESSSEQVFEILCALCLIGVIIWYVWNYRKKQMNQMAASSPKTVSIPTFNKDDCDSLKEVHKLLRLLNSHLEGAQPSRNPHHLAYYSGNDARNKILLPGNQLATTISKLHHPERESSNADFRQILQTALHRLEEVIINNENTPLVIPKSQDTFVRRNIDLNCREISLYKRKLNQKFTSIESERRQIEQSIKFGNESIDPNTINKIDDRKLSLSLERQKDVKPHEKYSKHQLSPVSHKYSCLIYDDYSPKHHIKQRHFPKSVYSDASSLLNLKRDSSNEEGLKEKLLMTLEHLEKEDTYCKFETRDSHEEDTLDWNYDGEDSTTFKTEGQRYKLNSKSSEVNSRKDKRMQDQAKKHSESSGFIYMVGRNGEQQNACYNTIKDEDIEPYEECLEEKESLSLHYRQVDSKETTRRRTVETKDKSLCITSSKNTEVESVANEVNVTELKTTSTGKIFSSGEELPRKTVKLAKRKNIMNVSAQKKALNISILFNRDIQLPKSI